MKLQAIVASARIALALVWRRLRGRPRGGGRPDTMFVAGLLLFSIAFVRANLTDTLVMLMVGLVGVILLALGRRRRRGRGPLNMGLSTHRDITPAEEETICRMSQERMHEADHVREWGPS